MRSLTHIYIDIQKNCVISLILINMKYHLLTKYISASAANVEQAERSHREEGLGLVSLILDAAPYDHLRRWS